MKENPKEVTTFFPFNSNVATEVVPPPVEENNRKLIIIQIFRGCGHNKRFVSHTSSQSSSQYFTKLVHKYKVTVAPCRSSFNCIKILSNSKVYIIKYKQVLRSNFQEAECVMNSKELASLVFSLFCFIFLYVNTHANVNTNCILHISSH